MKEHLMHNFGLKIISVFFATLLWFAVTNVDDPTVTQTFTDIPVTIINDDVLLSRGYQYSVESGERVDVKVKGKQSVVDNLSASDFSATADFNALNKEMYMTVIKVVCNDERAAEIQMTPLTENMAIKREEQETKSFNLDILYNGSVKRGYFCYGTVADATLIQATGSVSQIENVKTVAVNINIDGKSASFESKYEVVAYDATGKIIDPKKIGFSQDQVKVETLICPTKVVPIEVVPYGVPAEDYYLESLEYAPQEVMIAAEENVLRNINKLLISCDVSNASSNVDVKQDLQTYLNTVFNGSCYDVDSTPIGMVAVIKPVETKRLSLSDSDIELRNVPDNMEATVYPLWDLSVDVSGPGAEIEKIDVRDLKIYVDMWGCEAGTLSKELLTDYRGDLKLNMGAVMIKVTEKAVVGETAAEDFTGENATDEL